MKKIIGLINIITILIIIGAISLIKFEFNNLPELIPFFYTNPWGKQQLASKLFMWIIPSIMTIIGSTNLVLSIRSLAKQSPTLAKAYSYISLIFSIILAAYVIRIITIATHQGLNIPIEIKLTVIPMITALTTTLLFLPVAIKIAKKYGLMDDPLTHKHPAMLLTKPIPRIGETAFFVGFLVPLIIFVPILSSQKVIGILLGVIICVILGIIDTKRDPHPLLRLGVQIAAVFVVSLSGIIMIYLPNPFGGAINLDQFRFSFDFLGTHSVYYLSVIAAAIWMGWVMNFMSWGNGTDGVYGGLVTLSSLAIALLMLQALPDDPSLDIYIKIASIVTGTGIAMTIYTWPPQKLLWGFGAIAPALIIAALSIIGSTKISTTLFVLLIPFLDAIFAIVRRIRRGQLPIWGDREHLHHKLLDMGWSKQQVAIFYWSGTIVLFMFALASSGQTKALYFATFAIIFAIGVVITNLINLRKKRKMTKA